MTANDINFQLPSFQCNNVIIYSAVVVMRFCTLDLPFETRMLSLSRRHSDFTVYIDAFR